MVLLRRTSDLVQRGVVAVLVGLVRGYQLVLSPLTPPSCRYYPSCSAYAVIALRRHGVVRGLWLAGRRLLRCHPWAAGGVDDVPPARPAGPGHHASPAGVGTTHRCTTPGTRRPGPLRTI